MSTPAPESEAVSYEMLVLRRMVEQLPDRLRVLFLGQLEKFIHALEARDRAHRDAVLPQLQDAALCVQMLLFDLEATRRERDALQNRLDQL
jgi:hypothetical protein